MGVHFVDGVKAAERKRLREEITAAAQAFVADLGALNAEARAKGFRFGHQDVWRESPVSYRQEPMLERFYAQVIYLYDRKNGLIAHVDLTKEQLERIWGDALFTGVLESWR